MEVSVENIKGFFSLVEFSLLAASEKFRQDCQDIYTSIIDTYLIASSASTDEACLKKLRNDFDRANATIEVDLQYKKYPEYTSKGTRFVFTDAERAALEAWNALFTVPDPNTSQNDLSTFLKVLTDELLRGADSIPVFLFYIKQLYQMRWKNTLQRCDASEILAASLTNLQWIALTDGFEALLKRAFDLSLISEQQLKKMPVVLLAGVLKNKILVLDRFELFYPGLKRHYELSIDSFKAYTGFFWMPDLKDLKPDGKSYLPVRLYTPSEEVLLRKNYGSDFTCYLDYFVTSERSEPPIMSETFERLRGLVEKALLFEYTVTRDTHRAEIIQLIGGETENEWLVKQAVAIKGRLPEIKEILKSLSEEDPKKEQLAKYIRFREAKNGPYDCCDAITDDLKKVLLVACSVLEKVEVSELEARMSKEVSDKLKNLTSAELFKGEKNIQEEKLNEFTKKFVGNLDTMDIIYGKDAKKAKEAREKTPKEDIWLGGAAEIKRLKNQVLHLKDISINSKAMAYATFGGLVHLMAPKNQVASACAHTIWRSFLLGLMTDYMPKRRFDERLERRFDGRLEDEIGLPEMRERSRNRVFYVPLTNVSCFSSIAFDGRDMRPAEDSPSRASPFNISMGMAREQEQSQEQSEVLRKCRSLESFPVPVPVPVPGKV